MLLAGVAVSSPKHAHKLHPSIFANEDQARKAFSRGVFKGHFPISDIYGEMSLNSASYRVAGRGQGWETAWWLSGAADGVRSLLNAGIGPIASWKPDP